MSFPEPSLLPSIEDLLAEVHWLEGLILVTDAHYPTFVSSRQLTGLCKRICRYPSGEHLNKLLRSSMDSHSCRGSIKPVLVLKSDGRYWLGLMGAGFVDPLDDQVRHLHRCYELANN